jgi:hypothetical protein
MDATSKRNIEAMGKVVELIAWERETRKQFLEEPVQVLEEIGLVFSDKKLEKHIVDNLKEALEKDFIIDQPGAIDPIGPVADIGAAIVSGVVTGVVTGAVTYAVDVPPVRGQYKWDKVKFNHTRINRSHRLLMTERRILAKEAELQRRLVDRIGGGTIR